MTKILPKGKHKDRSSFDFKLQTEVKQKDAENSPTKQQNFLDNSRNQKNLTLQNFKETSEETEKIKTEKTDIWSQLKKPTKKPILTHILLNNSGNPGAKITIPELNSKKQALLKPENLENSWENNQKSGFGKSKTNVENNLQPNQKTNSTKNNLLTVKSFENDMNPSERKLLLTSILHSKQDEIDQHLARRSVEEDLEDLTKNLDNLYALEVLEAENIETEKKVENKNNLGKNFNKGKFQKSRAKNFNFGFDTLQKPKKPSNFEINPELDDIGKNSEKNSQFEDNLADKLSDFDTKSRQKVNKEFDLDKQNWNKNSKRNFTDSFVIWIHHIR